MPSAERKAEERSGVYCFPRFRRGLVVTDALAAAGSASDRLGRSAHKVAGSECFPLTTRTLFMALSSHVLINRLIRATHVRGQSPSCCVNGAAAAATQLDSRHADHSDVNVNDETFCVRSTTALNIVTFLPNAKLLRTSTAGCQHNNMPCVPSSVECRPFVLHVTNRQINISWHHDIVYA